MMMEDFNALTGYISSGFVTLYSLSETGITHILRITPICFFRYQIFVNNLPCSIYTFYIHEGFRNLI